MPLVAVKRRCYIKPQEKRYSPRPAMKPIRILVALAALPVAIFQAHAGIGWDLKECEQHYGSPVGGPFEGRHGDSHNYHFHARSWEIWANFSDSTNRVIMISYSTQNQQLLEKNWNKLLQENAPGGYQMAA
jgi:hypothetical protein